MVNAQVEDEFEGSAWLEDDEVFFAASQVEQLASQQPRKRRRLDSPPSDVDDDAFDPPLHSTHVETSVANVNRRQPFKAGAVNGGYKNPTRRISTPQKAPSRRTPRGVENRAPGSGPGRLQKSSVGGSGSKKQQQQTPDGSRPSQSCGSSDESAGFDPSPHPQRSVGITHSAVEPQSRHRSTVSISPSRASAISGVQTPSLSGSSKRHNPVASGASGPNAGRTKSTTATQASGSQPDADALKELEGLPSDAFSSSPTPSEGPPDWNYISSQASPSGILRRPAPHTGFRQTTLFGDALQQQANERPSRLPPPKAEPPTHHELDREALETWVYPVNLGSIRDYQYNIVSKGLFHNLLVALPTGLGKTFIAATIMLNWFRWTSHSQIIFVAPTKPLVAQQVDACFGIAGIPRSQTTMLTGDIAPGLRAEEWSRKRMFFMTPQTLINDLKLGACDPKKIVCVVVDEAHRATGGYAYVEVIKFMRRFNSSFRVLALTATPGASVEAVQEVIDGLDIARVEIRTEESLDIRQYVHNRRIETVVFDPSPEIDVMRESFAGALKPILDQLNQANAYWCKDPMSLTPFGLMQARSQWMSSPAGRRATMGFKGKINTIFSLLASLAHAIGLLNFHGIGPFYHNLLNFRTENEKAGKGSKYKKQIIESTHFQKLMSRGHQWINDPEFIGHPKLEYLRQVVLNHFLDKGEEGGSSRDGQSPSSTRIMVFVHFRDSAEEVVRVLKRNEPMIRPHVFVGQATAKGSEGMNQKAQLDVVQKFQKGTFNTLVATCVGEEGLDIGEVDLIVCYDSSASPIRMLQRMGRTGRKRAGNIVLLLMRGKEENSFTKAKDNYEKMQQMIESGSRFIFHEDMSPRILPRDIQPVVDKKIIEIPLENTQAELPVPRKRGKPPKRPPKKFHMPDGVRTGFVKASRIHDDESDDGANSDDEAKRWRRMEEEEGEVSVPPLESVVLSKSEEGDLGRLYQQVYGGDGVQVISMPRLDAFPKEQRRATKTKFVTHSRATLRMISTLQAMHGVEADGVGVFENNLHPDDRDMTLAGNSATNPLSSEKENVGSSAGHPLSSPSSPRPTRRRRTSRPSTSPADEEDFDDMDGFIVDDDDDDDDDEDDPAEQSITSVTSSPPSINNLIKPFYTSAKDRPDSLSDDDLPEVSTLVEPRHSTTTQRSTKDVSRHSTTTQPFTTEKAAPLVSTQRRKRRRIIADSENDSDSDSDSNGSDNDDNPHD